MNSLEQLEARVLLAAPIVVDDIVQTATGTPVSFNPTTNDSDADGNTLSVTAVSAISNGSITQSGNTLTFTPTAGFVGQDTLLYTVSDGTGNSATGSIVVTVNPVGGATAARPFGQHVDYAAGTILPSHRTQAQLDDDVRAFYETWKSRYLVSAGTSGGNPLYRVAFGLGSSETVSEGQGFGMVITALMAGHDPNAKQYFDGLWRFSRLHPSTIDSRLMDWKVPATGGDDSAFDGDADIAYGLLLAHAQWGSTGAIKYAADASTVIAGIYGSTIGPTSKLPELGDWVSTNGSPHNQYTPRSSDFMPSYFRAFGRATNSTANWNAVVAASQSVINSIQTNYSPVTGLLPDFIVNANTTPQPAPAGFLEGANDGSYAYNAGRDPLRIGLDGLLNGDATSLAEVRKISNWAQSTTSGNPANFKAGYALNGTALSGSNYFTTFFVAPLGVAAMTNASQQNWLNAIYDSVYSRTENYYEDTVNLLSLVTMTGNFFDPTATASEPPPPPPTNPPASLPAVADAHVRNGTYTMTNYGTTTGLNVRNHTTLASVYEGFLRFDLSGVAGGAITSAVLMLTPNTIGAELASVGEFRVRMLADASDNWIEGNGGTNNNPVNEITWSNKPTGTSIELLVPGSGLVVNQPKSMDVTALLTQSLNANKLVSFHLDIPTASSTRVVNFYTDEYATAAYRPVLQVTTLALPNNAPVANDDSATTTAGTAVTIAALTNDSDPDGDVLDITTITGVENGTVTDNANVLTFTPAAGFVGTETFSYTLSDGRGGTDTASATVTVTAAPIVLSPVADAHVRNGSYTNANYGLSTGINVRNHATLSNVYESLLRFDLSGVSGTVTSAVLKLTPSAIGAEMTSVGEFRVRMLADSADNWVEGDNGTNNNPVNEVRWNNKPTGTGTELRVPGSGLVLNQPISINVLSLLGQSLNANSLASFHLDVPIASTSRSAFFYSDEHGTAAYRPVLVITTAAAPPPPTASISDISLTETNSGSSTATFNVTLSSAATSPITLSYATANGTATSGSDFTAASGTITFAAGETTKSISVSVLGDTTDEITETFVVNLSSPVGATISDAQGIGSILDNDDPSASINDVTVTEGNSGTTTATFTVTLSNAPVGAVTVNFATANSTATSGSDYTSASGTVSFASGEMSKSISVSVLGDTTDESNETFFINLSGAVAAIILDAQGVGTITDNDDPAPPPSTGKRIVGYFPSWGVYGRDYQVADIAADQLTHLNYAFANIGSNLQIAMGDTQVDPSNFAALQTLKQSHPQLQSLISVGGWTWSEHFSDVALTAASRQTFATSAVNFMTQHGFDGIDIDWEFPVSGGEGDNVNRPEDKHNYTLLMQELRSQLNVLETQNGRDYWLSIAAPAGPWTMQNLELAPLAATLDWINLMAYDLAGSWDPITGHNAALYDQTGNPADDRLNWNSAVDAYLAAGVPASQLVVGAAFNGHVFGGVSSTNNGLYQADSTLIAGTFGETGTLTYWDIQARYLASGSGYTRYWDGQGQVPYLYNPGTQQFVTYDDPESIGLKADYINNRDLGGLMFWELSADAYDHSLLDTVFARLGGPPGPPSIRVSDASVIEGNSGTSTLTFNVTLNRAPAVGESVSVSYGTANGTATAGSDYTAASGALTFAPGESSRSVSITVLAEALQEANETLLLNLSNPTGGTIADAQGIGTITDDDTPIAAIVDFNITSDWITGHGASVTITNNTTQPINAWRLEFDYAGNIVNTFDIWNAKIVSHVGTRYVIEGEVWNPNIATGGSVNFGFNATGPGTQMLNATLNGLAVSVI